MDLEHVAVAPGVEEHERDRVRWLADVPPAPAVVQGEVEPPGVPHFGKGLRQGAAGLVGRWKALGITGSIGLVLISPEQKVVRTWNGLTAAPEVKLTLRALLGVPAGMQGEYR